MYTRKRPPTSRSGILGNLCDLDLIMISHTLALIPCLRHRRHDALLCRFPSIETRCIQATSVHESTISSIENLRLTTRFLDFQATFLSFSPAQPDCSYSLCCSSRTRSSCRSPHPSYYHVLAGPFHRPSVVRPAGQRLRICSAYPIRRY